MSPRGRNFETVYIGHTCWCHLLQQLRLRFSSLPALSATGPAQALSRLFFLFVKIGSHQSLVAPYCAIPRDYLSDTPLLRAMGLLVSQHGQLGAIPPPPFLSLSPLESMRSGGAIAPLKRGVSQRYSRDTL